MPRTPKPGKRTRTSPHAQAISVAFGKRLRQVRDEKRIGQDAFAELLGVSRTTASNIERGVQRVFLDQVFRAAEILQVPLMDLLRIEAEATINSVRAAADNPLTPTQERRIQEIVREVVVGARRTRKEA
jgi:transcriptional regulator with XRE-family HTH domain